ncbi:MAG: hypothetical protein HY815_09330 [Candidatus Riflebacteria bacterium]|nr:hypothetical protein [Candidatus Riflebacteria bacterium]
MNENDDEGPGQSARSSPPAPLGDTFPEFIDYARKRRRLGPRQAAMPEGATARPITPRQLGVASGAVLFIIGIVLLVRLADPSTRTRQVPSWVKSHKQKLSALTKLPKPQTIGQVPEAWGVVRLGMRKEELEPARLVSYQAPDAWADLAYVPDPDQPDAFFGLSFYQGRIYKISLRIGEDSTVVAAPFVAEGAVAYGAHSGYEYLTPGHTHVVTIFQTQSRALKIDAVKHPEGLYLSEVILVDLDQGALRERDRITSGR